MVSLNRLNPSLIESTLNSSGYLKLMLFLTHWIRKVVPLALLLTLSACSLNQLAPNPTIAPTAKRDHLALGNPSNATNNVTNADNYLMIKPQYALSYNNSKKTPNWVSWQLNQSWLGNAPRQNNFRPDDTLPGNWYRVRPSDYTSSGYDKGHMAPSADRTQTVEDNSATFLMTNMVPQAPDNNQGPWADLEDYCRYLVAQGKELYIIAGSEGTKGTIGTGKVTIPQKTWKVILVLDQPGSGIKGITSKTRVIAIEMPNEQGIRNTDWKKYKVSVRKIEANTGYNFFSNISPSIQAVLESKVDQDINVPKPIPKTPTPRR